MKMKNNTKKMRITGRFVLIAAVMLLSTMAAGCSFTKASDTAINSEAASTAERSEIKAAVETEAEREMDTKIEITDAAGRKVTLDKPAKSFLYNLNRSRD